MGLNKKKSAGAVVQSSSSGSGPCVDIGGNVYKTVKIGKQIWMAENLKVTRYRNGDEIPAVTDDAEWSALKTGARCVHDNDEDNADTYGYLYNWYAVVDKRNIAPEGWRVPTDGDWKALEMHLGMSRSDANEQDTWRGSPVGSKLAGEASLWGSGALKHYSELITCGFSALPAGYRLYDGYFYYLGYYASFWSATEINAGVAWGRSLSYYISDVYRSYDNKRRGFSVRLVGD